MHTSARSRFLIVVALGLALLIPFSGGRSSVTALSPRQDEVALILSGLGRRPVLGVPDFFVATPDAALTEAARALAEVLRSDIDFEREFTMIDRETEARVSPAPAASLPFEAWRELGADYVLAGTIAPSGAEFAIELRLISVAHASQGRQLYGAAFSHCTSRTVRACAHYMADDVHRATRALDGVARTRIAFTSDRTSQSNAGRPRADGSQAKEIFAADYDGANPTRVTTNQQLNTHPSWSPDGRSLAYTSWSAGSPDIFISALGNPQSVTRPVSTAAGQSWSPSWSPDGSRVAFASTRSGNLDVWVASRDGSGLTNLTNHPADDGTPAWSPDGAKIAFTSDRTGVNMLYVMSATGTGVEPLVRQRVDRPSWSKLNFIAFTLYGTPGHDVAIYDLANPGIRVLTDGLGSNEAPSVSPSGRHIAFETTRWGRKQIAIIDRAGGPIRRVTTEGNNESPSWGPLPGN